MGVKVEVTATRMRRTPTLALPLKGGGNPSVMTAGQAYTLYFAPRSHLIGGDMGSGLYFILRSSFSSHRYTASFGSAVPPVAAVQ